MTFDTTTTPSAADLAVAFSAAHAALQDLQACLPPNLAPDADWTAKAQAVFDSIDPLTQAAAIQYVDQLCQNQQFKDASVMAAILSGCQPSNSRISYLAALCQQHLQRQPLALALYAVSLMGDQPTSSTCYRIGECHAKQGDWAQALEAFDASLELSRQESDSHTIYELTLQARELAQQQLAG